MTFQHPQRRQWTRAEYARAWESGAFGDAKVELVAGEVLEKEARTPRVATSIMLANEALWRVFGAGFVVRCQMPLVVDDLSEPEPDAAVLKGNPRDFLNHLTSALLAVEVSDTTLATDLGAKVALYAQAQVAQYWVVDINARLLHVHRTPIASPALPNGYGYQTLTLLTETDSVSPLAAPQSSISVADLLL